MRNALTRCFIYYVQVPHEILFQASLREIVRHVHNVVPLESGNSIVLILHVIYRVRELRNVKLLNSMDQ